MWTDSSVVGVLARSSRGPGFDSRSGHVPFSSPATYSQNVHSHHTVMHSNEMFLTKIEIFRTYNPL